MRFGEKLARLTEGKKRAEVARDAHVSPSVLNNYINRGSEPMAMAALRLAKTLAVPLDWLLDDSQGFPPPKPRRIISQISDRDLMLEVAERLRKEQVATLEAIERAEGMIAKNDFALPIQQLHEILHDIHRANWKISNFQPWAFAYENHAFMPGAERKLDEFDQQAIDGRAEAVMSNPAFRKAMANAVASYKIPEIIPSNLYGFLLATIPPTQPKENTKTKPPKKK